MKNFIFVIGTLLFIYSCSKEKVNTVVETPCLNDSSINYVGKYVMVRYVYKIITPINYVKVYVDTSEWIITHFECNTLKFLEPNDYKFIFKDSKTINGTYLGTNKCHCDYQLTLIDKKNIFLTVYCGGGGSPCPLGRSTSYYEGTRIE